MYTSSPSVASTNDIDTLLQLSCCDYEDFVKYRLFKLCDNNVLRPRALRGGACETFG